MNDFWKHIKPLPKAQLYNSQPGYSFFDTSTWPKATPPPTKRSGSTIVGMGEYQGNTIPEYSGSWDEAFNKAREDYALHGSTTILWNGKPMNINTAGEKGEWSSTSEDPNKYPYTGQSREHMRNNPEYSAMIEEYRSASPARKAEMEAEWQKWAEYEETVGPAAEEAQQIVDDEQTRLDQNLQNWNQSKMTYDNRILPDNTITANSYVGATGTGRNESDPGYDETLEDGSQPTTKQNMLMLDNAKAQQAAYNMIFGNKETPFDANREFQWKDYGDDATDIDQSGFQDVYDWSKADDFIDYKGRNRPDVPMNLNMFGEQELIPAAYNEHMKNTLSPAAYNEWYNQLEQSGIDSYKSNVRSSARGQTEGVTKFYEEKEADLAAKDKRFADYKNLGIWDKMNTDADYFLRHPFQSTFGAYTDPIINLFSDGPNITSSDYIKDEIYGTNTVGESNPYRTSNQYGFGSNSALDTFIGSIPYHMANSVTKLPSATQKIYSGDDVMGGLGDYGMAALNFMPWAGRGAKALQAGSRYVKNAMSPQNIRNTANMIGDMSLSAPFGTSKNLFGSFNNVRGLFGKNPSLSKTDALNLNTLKDLKALPAGLSESTLAKYPNLYNTVMRQGIKNTNTSFRAVNPRGEGLNMIKGNNPLDDITKSGVNIGDDLSTGQYMATHVPGKSYGYRSGYDHISQSPYDALFTSAKPTGGMYGSQTWRVRPKGMGLDVQSGDINSLMNKYVTNRPMHGYENIPAYGHAYGNTGYKPILKFLEGQKNAPSGLHTIGDLNRPQNYVGMRGKQLLETVGKPINLNLPNQSKIITQGHYRPGGEAPYIPYNPYDLPKAQWWNSAREVAKRGVKYVDDIITPGLNKYKTRVGKPQTINPLTGTPYATTSTIGPSGQQVVTNVPTDKTGIAAKASDLLTYAKKPFEGLVDETLKVPTNIKNTFVPGAVPVQFQTPSAMTTLETNLVKKVKSFGKGIKENENVLKHGYGKNEEAALKFLQRVQKDAGTLSDAQFKTMFGWDKSQLPTKITDLAKRVNAKKPGTIGTTLDTKGHSQLRNAVGDTEYSEIIARTPQEQSLVNAQHVRDIAAMEVEVNAGRLPRADLDNARRIQGNLEQAFQGTNVTIPASRSASTSGASVSRLDQDIIDSIEHMTPNERQAVLDNYDHIRRNLDEVDNIIADHYQILPDGRRVRSSAYASAADAEASMLSQGVTMEQITTFGLDPTDLTYLRARVGGLQRSGPQASAPVTGSTLGSGTSMGTQDAINQGITGAASNQHQSIQQTLNQVGNNMNYVANLTGRTPGGSSAAAQASQQASTNIPHVVQQRLNAIVANDIQGPQLQRMMRQHGITDAMVTDAYTTAGRIRPMTTRFDPVTGQPLTGATGAPTQPAAGPAFNRIGGIRQFIANNSMPEYQGFFASPVKKFNTFLQNRASKDFQLADKSSKTQELVGSLFAGQGVDPSSVIRASFKRILNAPRGSRFTGSSSLSDDSWALNELAGKLHKKGQVDIKFSGYMNSNQMNFSQGVLPKELRIKEMNRVIMGLNENLPKGQKIPYAYIEGSNLKMPSLDVIRRTMGGETVPESEQHDTYDLNNRDIFTPYDEAPLNINDMDMEDALGVYRKYIEGGYDDTPNEKTAEKVYEMLNQKYYNAAQQKGMSVANYVMSNIRG